MVSRRNVRCHATSDSLQGVLINVLSSPPAPAFPLPFLIGIIGGVNLAGFAITAQTKTHKITDLTGSGAFVLSVVACAW